MNKVPITTVIKSWLETDKQLTEKCSKENCKYHSDSAYQGYVSGFNDGVASQCVEVPKQDIADAFKGIYGKIDGMSGLVSEDDCVNYISSSEQYWFFAGAMWMAKQMNNHKNE